MQLTQRKELIYIQVFFLFIFPIFLITSGIVSVQWRLLVFCSVLLLLLGIIRFERITDKELGIGKVQIRSIGAYSIFTLLGVLVLLLFQKIFGYESISGPWWRYDHLVFLFIPLSLLQEIAYRSFLVYKLRLVFRSSLSVILINAFLFGILHLIYTDPLPMFAITFIGGIGFAWLYYRFPDTVSVSISHIILNFAAIYLGFFSL